MRRFVSVANSLAVASRPAGFRATIATSTPSRANSRAMALPMPRLPPVTIACLSCNPRFMAFPPCQVSRRLWSHRSLFFLREPGARVTDHRPAVDPSHELSVNVFVDENLTADLTGSTRPERSPLALASASLRYGLVGGQPARWICPASVAATAAMFVGIPRRG
jgi:hypothetical protein